MTMTWNSGSHRSSASSGPPDTMPSWHEVVHNVLVRLQVRLVTYVPDNVLRPLIARARAVARELKLRNAKFIAGDLRKADLSDGTLFYSYCTCLSAKTRAAMSRRIAKARPGARIVTVTHALEHPRIGGGASCGHDPLTRSAIAWRPCSRRIAPMAPM